MIRLEKFKEIFQEMDVENFSGEFLDDIIEIIEIDDEENKQQNFKKVIIPKPHWSE